MPGENDYEYYEDAFQFSTNWELGVSISLTAEAEFPLLPGLSVSFSQALYEHTFTPNLACLVFNNATKAGSLKPASSVPPKIDIAKVQAVVDRTGHLPSGISADELASYTGAGPLPTSVKAAVDAAKNTASRGGAGGSRMVSLLVAVAAVALVL